MPVGSGGPNQRNIIEEIVALFGTMFNKRGVKTFLWSVIEKDNDQVKFAAPKLKANFIACELSVKKVITFGMALYLNK